MNNLSINKKIYPLSANFIQTFTHQLDHLLKIQGILLSQEQLAKMGTHAETLMIWNKKINLTAINCPLQMAEKHFYDSIMAASFLSNEIKTIADIGSGGGFPGIPMKIVRPGIKLLMIDASQKKVNFLKHIIHLLELDDVDAVHARPERNNLDRCSGHGGRSGQCGQNGRKGLHDPSFEKSFDAVISRALTDTESFAEMSLSLLKPDGRIYIMKAREVKSEIKQTIKDRYNLKFNHYILPQEKAERYLLELTPINFDVQSPKALLQP